MKRLLIVIVVLIILVAIIFGGFQFLKSKDLAYQESRAVEFLKIISSPDKMEMRIASDLVDLTYDWDDWDNRNENSIENIKNSFAQVGGVNTADGASFIYITSIFSQHDYSPIGRKALYTGFSGKTVANFKNPEGCDFSGEIMTIDGNVYSLKTKNLDKCGIAFKFD